MSSLKEGHAKHMTKPRVQTWLPFVQVGLVQQVDFKIQEGSEEDCEHDLKYVVGEFEKEDYFLQILQGFVNSTTGNLGDKTQVFLD